ncbi:hypothetical protein Tco_1409240 [Tanacetum coccineum]
MERKDTLSSCSNSEELQMQLMQDKAKASCMCQKFIKSRSSMDDDDDGVMACKYFLAYTQLKYDSKVNERQMQTIEGKVYTSKELDTSLVNIERSGTKLGQQDTSSSLGNDTDANDADIKPVYDEEPMAETTRAKTIEHTTSLIAQNVEFKAQLQEKGFAIATLKNDLRKLKGNSVDTKFVKPSILGKLFLQSLRNQSVVRQPTAFNSKRPRISKPRFASQVDVNNDLSKPVTTHYLPKEREFAVVKPHHVLASSESRSSSKNMPRYISNHMVHNHYLEEAKKKTQERGKNSGPSVMPSVKSQSTTNNSKLKPRINTKSLGIGLHLRLVTLKQRLCL